jgi:hypothetical protein
MDIIICVFACATIEKYKLELLKVIETWGERAKEKHVRVVYFLGEEQTEFIGDEFVYLKGVDNSYESASLKQNLGLKYIYDKYNYDYVLVCGTDTYVNIDQLILYLKKTVCGDYIGGGGLNPLYFKMDKTYYYHSGAGFILSKKALTCLSPFLDKMFNLWKQQCYRFNAHYLISACDACISFYLHQLLNNFIIKEPTLFYACNHKGFINNKICCGDNVDYKKIIVCHYMSLDDFDDYTTILKNNNFFVKL